MMYYPQNPTINPELGPSGNSGQQLESGAPTSGSLTFNQPNQAPTLESLRAGIKAAENHGDTTTRRSNLLQEALNPEQK